MDFKTQPLLKGLGTVFLSIGYSLYPNKIRGLDEKKGADVFMETMEEGSYQIS